MMFYRPKPIKITPEKKEQQEQKEITEWESIMELKLINNHTDKEYIFKSENDFGLNLKYFYDGSIMLIYQHISAEREDPLVSICQLSGFSIIEITRKKFKK